MIKVWFTGLPFQKGVEYQQAILLQTLLIGLIFILILIFPIAIWFLGQEAFEIAFLGPLLVILFATFSSLYLLRQGSFHGSAMLVLSVILISQMRSLLLNGLTDNRLFYLNITIPILFAGLTIGRRTMFATTAIILAFIGFTLIRDKPYDDDTQLFVGLLIVLGFFIFIVDQFGISLRQAFETARRQESEIALEKERLRVTLRSIGDAVITTDLQGKITFMNRIAEQVTSWQEQEAIGLPLHHVFKIINEETRLAVESPYDKVMKLGQIVGLANHTLLIRKDGAEIPIDDSGAPIRNKKGEIEGITLVFRDISERRQIELEKEDRHKLIDILLQTSLTASRSFDLSEVADYILYALDLTLESDFTYIILPPPLNIIKIHAYKAQGLEKVEAAFLALEDPVNQLNRLQTMLKTGKPLLISDTSQQKDWRPFPESAPLRSFLGVPIFHGSEVIGFIGLHKLAADCFQEEQVPRLQFFASQIAVVIQNAQIRQQRQELAILEDRQHLGRELHDSVTQTLFASTIVVKMLLDMGQNLPEKTQAQLEKLKRLNQGALSDMRTLLLELRQTDISSIELPDLINQLSIGAMGNSKVEITFSAQGEAKLPLQVHETFYRVTQEALNNIVKHAEASHAEIELDLQAPQASLTIKDNGIGFDIAETQNTQMGLQIMRERAEISGVDLKIESELGVGTIVRLTWTQEQ